MILRLLISLPIWALYIAMQIVLIILGWIFVPIAAALELYTFSLPPSNPKGVYHFTNKFMWLWDNFEDGIANDTYWKAPNTFLQIIYWSCLRNPVNNLRVTPFLSCKITAKKVGFYGSFADSSEKYLVRDAVEKYDTKVPQWFFAWCGWRFSNFYLQFNFLGNLYRFWIGSAKIYPTDIYGGPLGYREQGAGMVTQFKKVV